MSKDLMPPNIRAEYETVVARLKVLYDEHTKIKIENREKNNRGEPRTSLIAINKEVNALEKRKKAIESEYNFVAITLKAIKEAEETEE